MGKFVRLGEHSIRLDAIEWFTRGEMDYMGPNGDWGRGPTLFVQGRNGLTSWRIFDPFGELHEKLSRAVEAE